MLTDDGCRHILRIAKAKNKKARTRRAFGVLRRLSKTQDISRLQNMVPRRRLNWRLEAPDSLGLPVFGFRRHTRGHTRSRLLVVLAVYFWGSSGGCLTVSSVSRITRPELPSSL